MRKNHPPALTAEQYAKGAASAAGYEFGSALLLHLVGFAWATALLAGLGISVLFVLSFAAARGIAARRGHRQEERSRPESQE